MRDAKQGDIYADYVEEKTRAFAGREWVLEAVRDWLTDPDRPRVFLISGKPGCGKTALAGQLHRISHGATAPPAGLAGLAPGFLSGVHFCSARDRRWINPNSFAESLALQLSNRYPAFASALAEKSSNREIRIVVTQVVVKAEAGAEIRGVVIENLDVSGVKPEDAFLRVVREPLEVLARKQPGERFVFLVDALDEALRYGDDVGIVSLLAEAEHLPTNVLLLATSRPEVKVTRPLGRLGMLELRLTEGTGLTRSLGDVEFYARARLIAEPTLTTKLCPDLPVVDFVKAVADKSGGNFLYVAYQFRGLLERAEPITRESLAQWPAGLDGIYLEYLERVIPANSWSDTGSPVLGTLAVAQEALTEVQLAQFIDAGQVQVRRVLTDVRQFLEVDDALPPSQRTYAVYHQSFADFLLDPDRSAERWCDSREWHRRIADAYLKWYAGHWQDCDVYGLRHFTFHVLEGHKNGLVRLSEALDPSFIRAKSVRLGSERSVLADLNLALAAARRAGDLPLLLRWGWVHVGLRDRIAQSLNAESLPFYVLLGQVDRVRDMVEALDSKGFFGIEELNTSRRHVACALAQQGHVEQALDVAGLIAEDDVHHVALCEVAECVASRDRQLAMEIAARGQFASTSDEFCRLLAGHDDFVDRAVQLAGGRATALEAIALEVAGRDFERALGLIEIIPLHIDDVTGPKAKRGADAARATLAVREARTNPDCAFALFERLTEPLEIRRALVGIAAARSATDPPGALAFVDRYASRAEREIRMTHQGKTKVFPHCLMARRLALASVAAGNPNLEIQEEVKKRWADWSVERHRCSLCTEEMHLLARVDWLPFHAQPLARQIAHATLLCFVTPFREWAKPRNYDHEAFQLTRSVAAALAVFDVEAALGFVTWMVEGFGWSMGGLEDEGLMAVVTSLARFDPASAVGLMGRIKGYYSHLAHVAVVRTVGAYDFERALNIVDGVDPRYSRTKAEMLGVLGNQLQSDDQEKIRMVLDRFPRYVQSESFFDPMFEAAAAVAREMARCDFDKGLRLARRYYGEKTGGSAHVDRFLLAVIEGGSIQDPQRAATLADTIGIGWPQAQAYLAVARHWPEKAGALSFLQKAARSFQQRPGAMVHEDKLLASIAKEMAPLSPREAMAIATWVSNEPHRTEALSAAIRAVLNAEGKDVLKELTEDLLANTHDQGLGDLFALREVLHTFFAFLEVLDTAGIEAVINWLAARDEFLSSRMKVWHLAEADPEAALEVLTGIEGLDWGWGEVVKRRANRDPDDALVIFQRLREHAGTILASDVLTAVIAAIARRDPARAQRMIADESWQYESYKMDALAVVAGAVAERDPRSALKTVAEIPDDYYRSKGLCLVLDALAMQSPIDNLAVTLAEAADLADTVRSPEDRRDVYKLLLDALQAAPINVEEITAGVLVVQARGDRRNFFHSLPGLIRLACKGQPELSFRLEAELARVEEVLSA